MLSRSQRQRIRRWLSHANWCTRRAGMQVRFARTSLSIWRAVCQTVKAMRCRSVSVSSRSGVSTSLRLLFAVSCRVSPQRQQFARSQARDNELLFELVIGAQDRAPPLCNFCNFHISSIRRKASTFDQSNVSTVIITFRKWYFVSIMTRFLERLHRVLCNFFFFDPLSMSPDNFLKQVAMLLNINNIQPEKLFYFS